MGCGCRDTMRPSSTCNSSLVFALGYARQSRFQFPHYLVACVIFIFHFSFRLPRVLHHYALQMSNALTFAPCWNSARSKNFSRARNGRVLDGFQNGFFHFLGLLIGNWGKAKFLMAFSRSISSLFLVWRSHRGDWRPGLHVELLLLVCLREERKCNFHWGYRQKELDTIDSERLFSVSFFVSCFRYDYAGTRCQIC